MTNGKKVKPLTQLISITLVSPRHLGWKNNLITIIDSLQDMTFIECNNIHDILGELKTLIENNNILDLEKEYTRLFINALEGVQCPPYESVFKSPRRLMYHEPIIRDIIKYLKLVDVDLARERAVSPDHLGVLIELFYLLYTYGYREEAMKLYNDHLRFLLVRLGTCLQDKSRLEFYRLVGRLFELLAYCIPMLFVI